MIYYLIYWIITNFLKKETEYKGPVATHIKGTLVRAKITDNYSNMPFLKADGLIDSQVERNKVVLPQPEKIHWFWRYVPEYIIGLLVAYTVFRLHWG